MNITDPITLFKQWIADAAAHGAIADATAMCLATAAKDGQPSARMVLLKGIDNRGFCFYTNMESRKAAELSANPRASLCFYWQPLGRQVRIDGMVEQVTDLEADGYFATRSRESRLGAWSSEQSRPLSSRTQLLENMVARTLEFEDKEPVPRPPFWSGWRVVPSVIEFWQEGKFRLHDRDVYTRNDIAWQHSKLYP
jgi:pyridoxamine 5'-phosphate oxidase